MSKIKKNILFCMKIFFVLSLTLLGKFDLNSIDTVAYHVTIVVFWVSGIFKFMESGNELKDEIIDSLKDLTVAIVIIPLWYGISGNLEFDIEEMVIVVGHYIILLGIVYATKQSVKSIGSFSYFTHTIIPVIFIILFYLGVPESYAIIISLLLPEIINFHYFRMRIKEKSIKSA